MIRIVGGVAGGRLIKVPTEGTRPTSERAREALFNSLQSLIDLSGARVLDLYAGSGAVGLEALSRGAGSATFVDADRGAARVIGENAAALGLGKAIIAQRPAQSFAASTDELYQFVFADPPYAVADDELGQTLATLSRRGCIAADTVLVVERSARDPAFVWPEGFTALKHKRYGEGALWYGQHK